MQLIANIQLTNPTQVLLVFWYYKIALIAAEQAILSPPRVKSCASRHLHHVMSTLRSEKRIVEERMLLHVYIDTLSSVEDKICALTEFLQASEKNNLQQALTYLDLASLSVDMGPDSQGHLQHLVKASLLFEASGHRHGYLDTELLCISRGEKETLSADTATEKVQKLREIANKYSKQDYPLGEIRALNHAARVIGLFPQQPELDTASYEIDSRITELLTTNKATFIHRVHFIFTATQSIHHEADSGASIQALELQLEKVKSEQLPKMMGTILHLMATCYESLGNSAKALECESESLVYHKMGKDYIDISDSVFAVAFRKELFALTSSSYIAQEKLREAAESLEEWTVRDEEAGYLEGASEKYKKLALLEFRRYQLLGISGALMKYISWSRKLVSAQPGWNEALVTQMPISLAMVGDYTTAAELSLEVLQYYKVTNAPQVKINYMETFLSMCFLGMAETAKRQVTAEGGNPGDGNEENSDGFQPLPAGTKILERIFAQYERSSIVSLTVLCAFLLARAHRNLSPRGSSEAERANSFRNAIDFCSRAELKCDELRQDIWTFGGLQALLDKRQVVSKEYHRSLYSEALQLCLEADEISSAWVWVQKGKARGLADMLGNQYTLSLLQLERLGGDPDSLKLMAEEHKLVEEVRSAKAPEQAIALRRLLKLHQAEMRKKPLLAEYLSAREGAFDFISLDSIFDSLSSAHIPPGSKIVLIDWVILEGGIIAMITVDSRKQPVLHRLEITITVVEKWLRDHFKFPEGEEPDLQQTGADRILSKLNGLVEKLEECTNENDLLILSPTSLLHQLPLHALRVGGRILLDRNLVVYSSSLAVLRTCLNRSETKITRSSHHQPAKSIFFGVYEEEEHFSERRHIFNCVKTEAENAGAPYILGPEVTRVRVLETIKEADWIHFHGHVRYDRQNILRQGLVLSDGVDIFLDFNEEEDEDEDEEDDTEDSENSFNEDDENTNPEESHEDLFRIPDIFTLKLNTAHLTLIACDSSVQQIEPGDEPLGIISAFLSAGAASTVGTLWPTLSPAGRAFTKAFYENLRCQKEIMADLEDFPVISLAVALREAVRSLRADPNTSSPYCWAPFVLHGAWFCRAA